MPSRHIADLNLSKYSGYFLLLIFSLFSCSQERREILRDAKVLYCKKDQLTGSSDSLRDAVSRTLHKSLPKEMDSVVRERMIYINDAQVLSSFQEFKGLPDSVKDEIKKSDAFEKQLSIKLADVNFSIDTLEERMSTYLLQLGPTSTRGEKFLERYNKTISDPCKTTNK